jgi:hypothetical protein
LFIRKKKYEELEHNNKIFLALKEKNRPYATALQERLGDTSQKEYDEIVNRYKQETVSFSTYYVERLKWWKGQFDKKPEKHYIRFLFDIDSFSTISFGNLEDARKFLDEISSISNLDCFIVDDMGCRFSKDKIIKMKIFEGHPDPYTPEEIETWAKEQLEKEMRGWKVVKEEQKETDYKKKYNDYQDVLHAAHQNELRNAESIMNNFWQTYADRYKELLSKCVRRHDTNINQSDN